MSDIKMMELFTNQVCYTVDGEKRYALFTNKLDAEQFKGGLPTEWNGLMITTPLETHVEILDFRK